MEFISFNLIIIIAVVVVAIVLFFIALSKQYHKAGPNEALIISGGRTRKIEDPDGTVKKIGYRISIGGGTFVKPFVERVEILPLNVITLSLKTPEVLTAQGVQVIAEALAQVKISSEEHAIRRAAEQFLGKDADAVRDVADGVLEGVMRAVLGTMTVEEIYQNREKFAGKVKQAVSSDFEKMGLELLSFALRDINDTKGYLAALGQPRIAQVKKDASIAQAEADKEASIKAAQARKDGDIAKLKAETEISKANRDFETNRASFQVSINQAKAQADLAYDLEKQKMNQQIRKEESQVKLIEKENAIKIEEMEIVRREKELDSSVRKEADAKKYQSQAEADAESYRLAAEAKGRAESRKLKAATEAESIRSRGEAEAEAMRMKADAWKDYNEAAIYKMVIDALPELARAISEPLTKVDKIVMIDGGGEGNPGISRLTNQVAQVLAQMPTVVESLSGVDMKKLLEKLPGLAKEQKAVDEKSAK
ncbi:flotillin [candidate division KSB1 bacterium]|nr:flotillin [candidate division KSB1 bacterium]